VYPPPETVIVVTPVPPSEDTSATSSDPPTGVKLPLETVVALVAVNGWLAGADASSAIVPDAWTSSHATPPSSFADAVTPRVCDPDDGAVCLKVVYRSPFVESLTSSTMVTPVAVFVVPLVWTTAP
jgi:hypothetical protein